MPTKSNEFSSLRLAVFSSSHVPIMIADTQNTENTDRMGTSPKKYFDDETVESSLWDSTVSERNAISRDLLVAVGKTERSFERELSMIRQATYLPGNRARGYRSNLHKELSGREIPKESDNLLGILSDDSSLESDDQSHSSKLTFGSALQLYFPFGVASKRSKANNTKVENKAKLETFPQYDSTSALGSEQSSTIDHSCYEHLMMEIRKNLKMHRLAADYFKFQNFVFFQLPQAVFAIVSTILAFMGAVDVFEGATQTKIVTIAGFFSALVVLLQTLSAYCTYGTRASMHEGATMYLRELDDESTIVMSKLNKSDLTEIREDESHQESLQASVEMNETYSSLLGRYRHSLKGCKSDVPIKIREAFAEVDSFVLLSRTSTNRMYLMECGMFGSQEFRGITLKAYDRLGSNMVGYFFWPLKIPCPKEVVRVTIEETRSDLHRMRSFWETPPPTKEPFFFLKKKTHPTF